MRYYRYATRNRVPWFSASVFVKVFYVFIFTNLRILRSKQKSITIICINFLLVNFCYGLVWTNTILRCYTSLHSQLHSNRWCRDVTLLSTSYKQRSVANMLAVIDQALMPVCSEGKRSYVAYTRGYAQNFSLPCLVLNMLLSIKNFHQFYPNYSGLIYWPRSCHMISRLTVKSPRKLCVK